jgi:dephospho-CoA kinase
MSTRPYLVGLTGGIASGKSAVGRAFRNLGVEVVDADAVSREVVAPGQPALTALAAAFGTGILRPDGTLDRPALRQRVFADPAALATLNGITHPAIRARLMTRAAAARGPYAVLEVPLLVEGGLAREVDRILVVDCSEDLQRERLRARDGTGPAEAAAILAAQASRSARLAAADDVIANAGSLADLDAAVATLHARYLALAAGRPAGQLPADGFT